MTDKVQKIREEVEIIVNRRLNLINGDYFDLSKETNGFTNEIMDIINSLQEKTYKRKKSKISDILLEFYEEYQSNMPNRPMIPSIYAGKILDSL